MRTFPIGIQPYTVREQMAQDYLGTLDKLGKIGYRGIELGPPPEGITFEQQQAALRSAGLEVVGCHGPFNGLEADWDQIIGYLHKAGGRYLAFSLMFASREEVLEKSGQLNRIGRYCKERGVQVLYHNHDWEFARFGEETAYDLLIGNTDPDWVKLELDTYWLAKAGQDPADYLRTFRNRCPLLHIKDMEATEEKSFAEIGEGVLDFRQIAQAAEEAGTEWLIVEQDQSRRDPLESLAISYRNLQAMQLVEGR